jgi:glycosyltransferase involved in cell wall biosynthesis
MNPAPAPPPLRLLCIDHEGGHGGSSHSLYNSLTALDQGSIKPTVWCRRNSKLVELYQQRGIHCVVKEWIPRFRVQNTTIATLYNAKTAVSEAWNGRKEILGLSNEHKGEFDLIHLNYESLLLFGLFLKQVLGLKLTIHMRTRVAHGFLMRLQNMLVSRLCQNAVFITGNEKKHFLICGGSVDGPVIFNPVPARTEPPASRRDLDADKRIKIALIGNFSWLHGHNRLIDIANALTALGASDKIVFVVAGKLDMPFEVPAPLGDTARAGGDFAAHVRSIGLGAMFNFLGHVPDPERVIASCDAVIKPSHRNEPWGRDVIEAMYFGKPVLATGTVDSPFVTEETGILFTEFDAKAFARAIISIGSDQARFVAMGNAGAERIRQICSRESRAEKLRDFWLEAAATDHGAPKGH